MEPMDAHQQKKRRDTPTPAAHLSMPPLVSLGDELEEKAAAGSLGVLVEVPIEDDGDDVLGETDALQRRSSSGSAADRGSWMPASPTVVQLPSRPARDETPLLACVRAPVQPTNDEDEEIDAEVFNALPAELQAEILADHAATRRRLTAPHERERREASPANSDSDDTSSSRLEDDSLCWVCHVCTFANHPQLTECEMCETLYVLLDDDAKKTNRNAFSAERVELRDASHPSSSGRRSRASSAGNELYAKLSQRLGSSAVSRSLKKIRLPATPVARKLTMKDDPTADDLLLVATAKLQQLQSSASQTITHAKHTIAGLKNQSGAGAGRVPSAVASSELGVLQRDLNRKCEAGDELFETLLQRLWDAVYQDAPVPVLRKRSSVSSDYTVGGDNATPASVLEPPFPRREFARVSDGWVAMGFQSATPDTDFRGGGVLALKCLVYAFEAFPTQMRAIAAAQKPAEGKRWYPVCVAGINLTCMLAGLLQLGNGEFDRTPGAHWTLFEDPSAFFQLFYYSASVWSGGVS